MCVMIISGKKPDVLVEIGINSAAEMDSKEGDEDFLRRIQELGKFTQEGQPEPFVASKFLALHAGAQIAVSLFQF